MKKLVIAALVALPLLAQAETVYVYDTKCVGDNVNLGEQEAVLYTEKRCDLPLADTKHLRSYETNISGYHFTGCWGRLLGEKVLLIDGEGNQAVNLAAIYATAKTTSGGKAVITDSPFQKSPTEQFAHRCH